MAMPQVTVKFFGPAQSLAGAASFALDIGEGQTVGEVAGLLADRFPQLGSALGVRLAVNRAYVPLSHRLGDGDEIAVIPPVTGCAPLPRVRLTREPIEVADLTAEMQTRQAGAIAAFTGTVRAETQDGKQLTALDYHAYEEMALEQLQSIRNRAVKEFGLLDAAVVHRLDMLKLGEASIAVIAVAGHRAAAFDACRWIVDQVKCDAPIWKKDCWSDGTQTWVDGNRQDLQDSQDS